MTRLIRCVDPRRLQSSFSSSSLAVQIDYLFEWVPYFLCQSFSSPPAYPNSLCQYLLGVDSMFNIKSVINTQNSYRMDTGETSSSTSIAGPWSVRQRTRMKWVCKYDYRQSLCPKWTILKTFQLVLKCNGTLCVPLWHILSAQVVQQTKLQNRPLHRSMALFGFSADNIKSTVCGFVWYALSGDWIRHPSYWSVDS